MSVAAGVVSDRLIVAAIASFEMSAERRRSASADIAQYLRCWSETTWPNAEETASGERERHRHFQPISCHAVLFPPESRVVCGSGDRQEGSVWRAAWLLADNTNRVRLQLLSSALTRKEPVLGLPSAPVRAQDLQQLPRQHRLARELALALADMDDHPLAVDVGDLKIERLLTTQACAVVQGQQRSMLDVHLCIEHGTDFLTAPDCGELAPHLRLDDLLIEPSLLQCPRRGTLAPTALPGSFPRLASVR